jgi:hypothetical protein
MVDGASHLPELPYLHHPGRCPHCGAELWPEADQVVLGGSHLKSDDKGGFITVGLLVSYDCPQCGANLASGTVRLAEVARNRSMPALLDACTASTRVAMGRVGTLAASRTKR